MWPLSAIVAPHAPVLSGYMVKLRRPIVPNRLTASFLTAFAPYVTFINRVVLKSFAVSQNEGQAPNGCAFES